MIYKELPTAFTWYDKLEKQNRYNENTGTVCDYQLITPADALLPFEFYRETPGGVLPNFWLIKEVNSGNVVANISANIPLLFRTVKEGREYIYYQGNQLTGLALAPGYYYSQLIFPGDVSYYSEMFFVPENFFYIAADNNVDYLQLQWWNNSDLRPIFYNNKKPSGEPYFRNRLYLDAFITSSEPEITEDGVRDGNDELITTFQKVTIPHKITVVVPDFLKKALSVMAIHDVIWIRTKNNVRDGYLEGVKINSVLEANGALSVVDILFYSEIALVKKGCADNMV